MRKVDLSKCLAALVGLLMGFEQYPRGAMWVGGLAALGMVCYTIVSLNKNKG
jgi:uncharacterized membrane protein YjjB (DUF3815 family)